MAKASSATKIKLVPLGERVVVKRAAAEDTTAGGIVLPESAKDKPQRGEVVAVGEGYTKGDGTKVALTVKEGDIVLYGKYAGQELNYKGQDYLIMREDDILVVLD